MKKYLLPTVLSLVVAHASAQNVGINTTGAAPDASAMLDVSATNKGLLIPRVALTASNSVAPVTGAITSLLVYNTATAGTAPNNVTPGFYYWNGAAWLRVMTGNGTAWTTTGNAGTVAGTNFLGTTDAVDMVVRTNNTERMRITSAGNVGIGNTGPTATLDVTGPTTGSGVTIRASGGGDLLLNSGGSLFFDGNYSYAGGNYIRPLAANTQAYYTAGVERMRILADGRIGVNITAPAAGDLFSAQNQAANPWPINAYQATTGGSAIYGSTTVAGSLWGTVQAESNSDFALAGTSVTRGITATATSLTNTAFGGQFTNDGTTANVGGWQCCWTARKIWGAGSVSTIVDGLNGEKVTLTASESPDILLTDYGTGQLQNGKVTIQIDPIMTKNIHVDETHPIKIFVQLEGDCNGVYVTNKSAVSFDVVELAGGTSNTKFSWQIVAHRADEVYHYNDGTTKISNNSNSRFQKVDDSFYIQNENRNVQPGRKLVRSTSSPVNE